jgi:UDP-glucose 4-epimerase
MKRILITGANGFLGSHVAKHLQRGHHVVGLVRQRHALLPSEFTDVYTDVDELVRHEPAFDEVYHLASFVPSGKDNTAQGAYIDSNVLLTAALVKRYWSARFVFSSSVSVYGVPVSNPLHVTSPFNNPGLYGLSKLAGEAIVMNHPNYAIVRFSSIVGPGMKPHTFIPQLVKQARSGVMKIFGDGSRKQNYIDVRDAAALLWQCGQGTDPIVTLGVALKSYTNLEVAQILAEKTSSKIEFEGEDNSPSFVYDVGDTYGRLSFRPGNSLLNSISDILKYENE